MLKTKKILSVLLSLVMMLGLFSVVASAANKVVDTAEIVIDTDIAGVDSENYESYIDILTRGLEFEDNYDDPGIYVYDSEFEDFYGNFVYGETYYLSIFLSAKPGYELGDITTAEVNGYTVDAGIGYWYPDDIEVKFVEIEIEITIGEDFYYDEADVEIDTADITIDTDIAGLYVEDYYSYINIFSDGLMFEDNYDDPAVFVEDSDGNAFDGPFEEGETYYFYVYLAPAEGYYLADEVIGYVNGDEISTNVDYWVPGGDFGDVQVDFVELEYSITVTGEPEVEELGFFARILAFFRILFTILFGGLA